MFDMFRRHIRERILPTEICIKSWRTNWDEERFLVEYRAPGMALGDKPYATYADALAFAEMEAKWHGADLIDETVLASQRNIK